MSDVIVKTGRRVIRTGKNITLFSDDSIVIKNVRASYPHLDKPTTFRDPSGKEGRATYNIKVLIPKTPDYEECIDLLNKRINRVKRETQIDRLPKNMRCLRDGDDTEKPEDAGMWTLSANEVQPPALRDRMRQLIPNADANKLFYGGCYVSVMIRMWGQKNGYGQRVNANLLAVQFVRDDEAFGRGRISQADVDDSFDDLGDDDSGYGDMDNPF
jgi:hypothetical protein